MFLALCYIFILLFIFSIQVELVFVCLVESLKIGDVLYYQQLTTGWCHAVLIVGFQC